MDEQANTSELLGRARRSSGLTLLGRFTVVSFLTTLAVGGLFGAAAARVAQEYAIRRQAYATAVYVSEFIAPRLVRRDFLQPPPSARVQFEFSLRSLIGKAGIVRVIVWSRNGQVLYSDDPALVGKTTALTESLRVALDGRLQWKLIRADEDGHRVQVFVPILVAGADSPVAVYEVLTDLTDLQPTLSRLRWAVWMTVVLGILILYGVLFTIVRRASRDLEAQQESLRQAFAGIVRSLANAVDARDTETGQHSSRVSEYAEAMARELGLSERLMSEVRIAGFLHDIGKIGIRDDILGKRGPLTRHERAIVQSHAELGSKILQPVPVPDGVKQAVRHSHEWWNGKGYPAGLAGEDIPLTARVIAVADAFEALTTDRPYRAARHPRDALEEIRRNAGTQFDPRVVEAFVRVASHWLDAGEPAPFTKMLGDDAGSPPERVNPRAGRAARPSRARPPAR